MGETSKKSYGNQLLMTKIKNSSNKVIAIGIEYVRSKDDAICRQKLNLMFRELSAQMVCLSEQNIELMRKLEKQK